MRKIVIFILLFSLFVFTGSSLADGHTMMDKLGFTGGLTYNTFAVEMFEDGVNVTEDALDPEMKDQLSDGMGFFVGGVYPLNKNINLEFGYDSATAKYEDTIDTEGGPEELNINNKLGGIYIGADYVINKNFNVKGLITSYNLLGEYKMGSDPYEELWKADGIGALIGAEYVYMLQNNANLVVNLAYRYAVMNVTYLLPEMGGPDPSTTEIEFDGSGIRLGVGVNLAF